MFYRRFIKILRNHRTSNVNVTSLPASCATTRIPTSFSLLLPDIVKIINLNVNKLCDADKTISIFGFQISSIPITSTLPQIFGRVINTDNPNYHFCCNLNYLISETKELREIESWQDAQTLVIDFTTGKVMDIKQYLSEILRTSNVGNIYGYLDRNLLDQAWRKIS